MQEMLTLSRKEQMRLQLLNEVEGRGQRLGAGGTSASAHTMQFGDIIHRFDADNVGMVSPQLPHNPITR